jgi:hypothetical protein
MTLESVVHLSDTALLAEVKGLADRERLATAWLIAALAELDARRLYLGEGCSSLFTYCTQVLRLSEHAAYGRIEAARAARRFPLILDLLTDGSITLTAVGLLSQHLTPENHRDVLAAARRKSKREVEELLAGLASRPDVPTAIRKLPRAKPAESPRIQPTFDASANDLLSAPVPVGATTKRSAVVAPIAPERYKVQFTASRETYDKLRRAQDLLRHTIPDGDPAAIVDRALTLLLAHLEKAKLGSTNRPLPPQSPLPGSRHIPAAVRREVWARDGGQCTFVGAHGRCSERGFLEFHHVTPFAAGGHATADNIQLRCRSHNAHEARQYFGFDIVREPARPIYSVWTERPPGLPGTEVGRESTSWSEMHCHGPVVGQFESNHSTNSCTASERFLEPHLISKRFSETQ